MSPLLPFLANRLWLQLCTGHHRRFVEGLDSVEEVQRRYLLDMVGRNSGTKYGRRHHFADISSVDDYRRSVPLTTYEDYLPYINDIAMGRANVLTAGPVVLFQPSSGTSSASKLIPYTKTLKAEFQRGIGAWVTSLFTRKPDLMRGTAYWCITPPTGQSTNHGRVPVGFDEDAEYLGFVGRKLYARVSAVPGHVASQPDTRSFLLHTLAHLLAALDLTLISVWSPTFLLLLLKTLDENRDEVMRLLADGGLPGGRGRARAVERILQKNDASPCFEHIWPNLGLISCWTHGPSELYAGQLKQHFPDVEVQGKGLIATEAFVSLPLKPDRDPVLAVGSHFFEFQETKSGDIRLAHELKEGRVYSVVVSTGGGLYRYRLGDLVTITGFLGKAPTLRFLSKEAVSDLFGEKLHQEHVHRSATASFAASSVRPSFFLLAPVRDASDALSYCLFLDAPKVTDAQAGAVRDSLERLLRQNIHYAACQQIGQLRALRLFLIDHKADAPGEVFVREMQRRGLKMGDVKPAVLDRETGWERRFTGRFAIPVTGDE